MSDTQNLPWLVERRSQIQSLLLQLSLFAENPPPKSVDSQFGLFQLLVGTAFSLWRAVFLVYDERQEAKARKDVQAFLQLLLRDNALNDPQEQRTHAWTVGYYLNNAYFRLHLAYQHLAAHNQGGIAFDRGFQGTVTAFLQEQGTATPSSARTNTAEQWDNAYEATRDLFHALSQATQSREAP